MEPSGRILYIGKAIDIQKRLRGHLSNEGDTRHRLLLARATAIDWTVTRSEIEALVLEAELIRIHKPPLNVRLRQDQRYPYLELTTDEQFPRLVITRKVDHSRNTLRFGPYPDARNLRALVDFLQDAFPLRRCRSSGAGQWGRNCVLGQIGKCPAPCKGQAEARYASNVNSITAMLRGDWEAARLGILGRMEDSSAKLRFEEAARWRDLLGRLDSFGWPAPDTVKDRISRDMCAVLENWGIVLQMRAGRFVGVVRLPFESRWQLADESERLAVMMRAYYAETGDVPREILSPVRPADADALCLWLREKKGSAVDILSPARGGGRELVALALRDLEHFLARLEWKRPGGRGERIRIALEALADMLGLPAPPAWMVALDASTVQGSYPVAALVSFRDGMPDKSGYRRFSMPGEIGRNDPAMISNAVQRFASHLEDGRFPDVFLIDGGLAQHRAAISAGAAIADRTIFVSIAKREESLLVGREERAVRIPADSPPILVLRAMRDEAHRFVVQYHRFSRSKGEIRSQIDDIPGIGPWLRAALLSHFGSVERLRAASEEDMQQVPGMGRARAAIIRRFFDEPVR
jgi:excinuclease ABC subunit C